MNNYPPGVTGNEYEIAGPDYEVEVEGYCPNCDDPTRLKEHGCQGVAIVNCANCGYEYDTQYNWR